MQYNITYRKKDKGWQYIISYKDKYGKWKQKSKQGFGGGDKIPSKECKTAALEQLKTLENDIHLKSELNEGHETLTFKDFGELYLEHKKTYASYKTIESTEVAFKRFSLLDKLLLIDISVLDIQKIVDFILSEGVNPNTIRCYLKQISATFNYAKNQYNIISKSPVINVKYPKEIHVSKRALEHEEIVKLLNDFKTTKYYTLVYISINTGMRLGEIVGLTWDRIDLKNKEIVVNRQWKKDLSGVYGFGKLKTLKSYRKIPISKDVANFFEINSNLINIDGRILDFKNTHNVIVCVNAWLEKFGFDINFHELRHTYGTKLIANGMDFKTAAEILGHDVQETIKTYSHVNSDMRIRAKTLIESIF